jgi:hypothetical protein
MKKKQAMANNVCPSRLMDFTTAASCSKTVTARVARLELFTKQLQSTSLFTLQLTKAIIDKFRAHRNLPQPSNLNEWRVLLVNVRSDIESYNIFYNRMNDRYKFLGDIITLALDAQVTLVGLQNVAQKIEEPLHSLWLFLLRLAYVKPFIVTRDDDENGTAVETVSSSLENFIAENITLKFPTAFSLAEHLEQTSISSLDSKDAGDENMSAVDVVGIGIPQRRSVTIPRPNAPLPPQPLLPTLTIDIGGRH